MATIDQNGMLHDYQGNTWDYELQFFSDEAGLNAQDINGWLFLFALKAALEDDDADALIMVSHMAGSGDGDDPSNGKALLRVESTKTAPVPINNASNPYFAIVKRVIPRDPEPPLVETLSIVQMVVDSQGLQRVTAVP